MNFVETKKISDIIHEIFPEKLYEGTEKEKENDSIITFMDSRKNFRISMSVSEAMDETLLQETLNKLSNNDLSMTFNSFYRYGNKFNNLFSINAIVIDIDHKKKNISYDALMFYLENDYFNSVIPAPNYIEHGNNTRLIYILKEPVYVAKHRKYKSFVKTVQSILSNKVKELGGDCQLINSYVRLPNSVNTKTGNRVEWTKYSDVKWGFNELIDEFLPNKKVVKKKKRKYQKRNWRDHYLHILKDIELAQKNFNMVEDEGHREKLCYLYRNYAILAGYDTEEAKQMTLAFNANFNKPLLEKEVLSKTNNVNYKQYLYKNETLQAELSANSEFYVSNTTGDRKSYKKEYYQKHYGKNRKKITNKIKSLILGLKNLGKKNKEILESLQTKGISLSKKSVERYLTILKTEGLLSPT